MDISEETTLDILDSVGALVAVLDDEGRILRCNRDCERLLGVTTQAHQGRPAWDVFCVAREATRFRRAVLQPDRRAQKEPEEFPWVAPDGYAHVLAWTFARIPTGEENPACILCTGQDVTERRRAEARTTQLSLVLRAIQDVGKLIISEPDQGNLLRGVCDSLVRERGYYNAWIALLDEQRRLLTSAEAGVGPSFDRLLAHFDRGELPECATQVLRGPAVLATEDVRATCTACPLAKEYGGRGAMSARLENDGRIYGLISVSVPVHRVQDPEEQSLYKRLADDVAFALNRLELRRQRREAEDQARRDRAELARVSRVSALGEMATALAHELNQPLCAITSTAQGCLRIAQSGRLEIEETLEALQDLASQAERASEVVRRIRGFVRKRNPDRGGCCLVEICRQACELAGFEAKERGATIKQNLPEDSIPVYGDPVELEQVVLNLVLNALEAMDDVEPHERRISVRLRRDDEDQAVLEVRDVGCGLPEEALDRLFDPFYTTKQDGIGMGLSIGKTIIEAHGGRLWASNNSDRGATFFVELPLTRHDSQ